MRLRRHTAQGQYRRNCVFGDCRRCADLLDTTEICRCRCAAAGFGRTRAVSGRSLCIVGADAVERSDTNDDRGVGGLPHGSLAHYFQQGSDTCDPTLLKGDGFEQKRHSPTVLAEMSAVLSSAAQASVSAAFVAHLN